MKQLLILLAFFITSAQAHDHGGMNGMDGRDGMDGRNGVDGIDGSYFNDTQLNRALSINAAMSVIPTSSHVDEHSHTSLGTGLGLYEGQTGFALGINHMQRKMSYKGAVGVSGSEIIIGIGTSYTFD